MILKSLIKMCPLSTDGAILIFVLIIPSVVDEYYFLQEPDLDGMSRQTTVLQVTRSGECM